MNPASNPSPAVQRIAAAVEASLDSVVSAAVEAIWEQVPAYLGSVTAGCARLGSTRQRTRRPSRYRPCRARLGRPRT